jgi:hypothetical protein
MRNVAVVVGWLVAGCAAGSDEPVVDGSDRGGESDRADVDAEVASDDGGPAEADAGEVPGDAPPADVPPEDVGPEVPVGLPDDARMVFAGFPTGIHPGEAGRILVRLANVGTATWTAAGGYALAPADGSDPFYDSGAELPADLAVPGDPAGGSGHLFELYVFGGPELGSFRSEWQLEHRGVGPFGPVAAGDVVVVPDQALCPAPVPPPVDLMRAVIHIDMGDHKVLDSTPLVWADGGEYCAAIGYDDYRRRCPPRPEGHPEVEICNEQAVGRALDTGRVGPTWTFNELPCIDPATPGRCRNHSENQFLVHVYGAGLARACGRNGVCGEVVVP